MTLGDFDMMPRATYCQPQVASFGYTEEQAAKRLRRQGRQVPVQRQRQGERPRRAVGFVKLIADGKYGELLGGHLIGPDVSELLPELTLAQKWELTANEMARNVHTHPTLSEAVQERIHGLAGHMINF